MQADNIKVYLAPGVLCVVTTGSTAERVAIVGDSAGGNLGTSVAMRCAMYGVRVPDGLLTVYGCFMVQYAPSPSRILSLMDPLLPLGVLAQVLAGTFTCV